VTKEAIIESTLKAINILPIEKAIEISDFANFLSERYEEIKLIENIQSLSSKGGSFDFLGEEEELYTLEDLKEVF
jgi:hypothetical protein